MDPLSITASIIGIIGGVSATYKTIKTIKGLPKAFEEVQNDLPLVLRTLRSAQDKLCDDQEITEDEKNDVVAILQPSYDKAQELQRVFDEVKKECENDKVAKDWTKVRSIYHKALRGMKASRVEQLMKDILGSMKKLALSQTFKSVSQHDMRTLEETLEKAISDISKVEPSLPDSEFNNEGQIFASQQNAAGALAQQNNVQGGTNKFTSGKYNVDGSGHTLHFVKTINVQEKSSDDRIEVQRCLCDLRVTEPRDDKKRIEEIKGGLLADSYRWILDNITFKQWHEDQNSRLLWVKGDPGKGKTMLLCGIIDELQSFIPKTDLLSYFFCQATDSRINNATAVLRGLLYMLVYQQPSLLSQVRQKYDYAGKSLFEDANAWVALTEIFAAVLRDASSSAVYLIIDALDECVTDLPKLLSFIVKQSSTSSHVKWVVSSRNWLVIAEELERAECKTNLSLELNADSVAVAVKTFIQQKVRQLAQEKRYTPELRDAVLQHLTSNANDTFLWAALVCQDLMVTPRWNVLKKLAQFPPGLHSLYKRMLQQISKSDSAEICLQVLAATAVLYQPVTVAELVVLTKHLTDFVDDLVSVRDIISLCGSFLTLRNDTVYFVHQSAKDFLVTKASDKFLLDSIECVHRDIFAKSLDVLHKTLSRDMFNLRAPGYPIGDVKSPLPDPLGASRYPCVYWIDHFCDSKRKSAHGITKKKDSKKIDVFLRQRYLYWLEALSLCRSMAKGIVSMTKLWHSVQKLGSTDPLNKIVYDAWRFIMYHKEVIENFPLQVYASALLFSPADSMIRRLFQQEELKEVAIKPAMGNGWSACLQTLEGHSDRVNSVVFSHDATWLASASNDRTIKIWDKSSGACLQTFEGHRDRVVSIVFSHDATWLASASNDKTIKIWDLGSRTCVRTLKGHSKGITSLAFSPNSNQLASTAFDNTVRIWDASSGACLQTLEGHSDWVKSVAFSHDSTQLASASYDKTIKIWHISSRTCLHTLKGHSEGITSLAFSPNSNQLASTALDNTVRIWDASSGACLQTLKGHSDWVKSVAFSHDSTRLASASSDSTIKIWDASSGVCLQTLEGHGSDVQSVAFSHDSTQLASASWDKTIKIWDISSRTSLQTPRSHMKYINSMAFSLESAWLASSSPDNTVSIWETSNGTCVHTLESHELYMPGDCDDYVRSVAFSHDSALLALGSTNATVRIWNMSSKTFLRTLEGHRDFINSMAFSHDSSQLASASDDDTIKIWDLSSGTCVRTLKGHSRSVELVAFSHDSTQLASASNDKTIKIWDANTGKCLNSLHVGRTLSNLSFHHSSALLHTEIGTLVVPSLEVLDTTGVAAPKPGHQNIGLNDNNTWITCARSNTVWIPSEYRPSLSTVSGSQLGMGVESGRVWLCQMTQANDNR